MKFTKLSLTLVSAVLFAACTGANVSQNTISTQANQPAKNSAAAVSPSPVDEIASARELYSKRCINCHRENGEGGIKDIEGEKIKVPSFKDKMLIAETDAEYTEQIEKGGDGMPAYKGKITDDEIKNLVRFIRKEFQGK